jgi:hypothetical protein
MTSHIFTTRTDFRTPRCRRRIRGRVGIGHVRIFRRAVHDALRVPSCPGGGCHRRAARIPPRRRRLLGPDGESPGAAVERFAGLVAAGLSPQHEGHLVRGHRERVIELLDRLAPTYAELDAALDAAGVGSKL